jgi:HEAT repeat protein
MLNAAEPLKRRKAALALSKIGDKAIAAIPALIGALQSEDAVVRRRAALALGKLGTTAQSSIPSLRMLQFDEDPSVVKSALEALSLIDKSTSLSVHSKRSRSRFGLGILLSFIVALSLSIGSPTAFYGRCHGFGDRGCLFSQ